MKFTKAERAVFSKIGKLGGAATKIKDSCREKGLQHQFVNGICTKCGASEKKALASAANAKKGGRKPTEVSKLAKKLGISRQAAWQRLNKKIKE